VPEPIEPIELRPVIAGKYELVRQLGQGSMGEVWLARHRTLREDVAIKLLKRPPWSDYFEDERTSAARFQLEAQVAARLSRKTKHIVRVTDHGEERGLAYLVMEVLEGMTLETRLMRRGPLSPAEVANVVAQLGRALEHAHAEGVVHRDLKPANVFLTVDEEGEVLVKVFDFGIACLSARLSRPHRLATAFLLGEGVLLGTPGYLSPEQARRQAPLDLQCDLWALATIAYEALAGELPLDGVDAPELLHNLEVRRLIPLRVRRSDLGGALDAFFERAFAEAVEDRFPSAREMVRAFDAAARIPSALSLKGAVEVRCEEAPKPPVPAIRGKARARSRRPRRPFNRVAACLVVASAVAAACELAPRAPARMATAASFASAMMARAAPYSLGRTSPNVPATPR
jgi:serine/threonine protein kinase